MDAKGGLQDVSSNGQVLHWTGRVLCADDLRRSLNGHRELVLAPRAIITPLAHDELRSRGVTITRQTDAPAANAATAWAYAQDRPEPLVQSVVRSLERDGVALKELAAPPDASACRWAATVARCVTDGPCIAGVVFCQDAGLLCCVANKVAGLRAVPVASVAQAVRARQSLSANLVALETAGRTFYEIRQILRTVCVPGGPACPPGVACTLGELDGHAHR
ncbi:MAG TPA: RpiB/LacA/LacB family sugar-phosphate isomerase [Gemmataceae bacterium]|jgi:ribose 5-phosphate isomerase RpiB|nr:RpiB/LacA/LacB family sugar-phosphate isomerase [Gemmataceae bacterium]